MRRVLATLVLLILAVYAGDFLSLRFRIPPREPYGSVEIRRYFAVALKNHKTEYMFEDPHNEFCVNSLFPHDGYNPCWYLNRHKRPRIDIDSRPPSLF